MFVFLGAIAGPISGAGCAQKVTNAEPRAIIGADDRTIELDPVLNAAVGAFSGRGGPLCTGFAIAKNEFATAAHCFIKDGDPTAYRLVTAAGTYPVKKVKSLHEKGDLVVFEATRDDLTFLKPAEDHEGGTNGKIISYELKGLRLLSSKNGEIARNLRKNGNRHAGVLLHSLDTVGGSSGSPILQNGKVVAIHVGHSPALQRNIAVELTHAADANVLEAAPDFERETHPVVGALKAAVEWCAASARCRDIVREFVVKVADHLLGFTDDDVQEKTSGAEDHPDGARFRKDVMGSTRDVREDRGSNERDTGFKDKTRNLGLTGMKMTSTDVVASYLGAAINEIYRAQYSVDAPEDIMRAGVIHVNNGASIGWLKVWLRGFPTFSKNGNNGTASCSRFCASPGWGGRSGSCYAAKPSQGNPILCSQVPGLLPAGQELQCTCVDDSFEKSGNNGTVNCASFCAGADWGPTGTCHAGKVVDTGREISCAEVVSTRTIDLTNVSCTCAR